MKKLDRFRLSLAVVDVVGISWFLLTFDPIILLYLLLFNIVVILIDTLRRGLIVKKKQEEVPIEEFEDEIPIDPITGNRIVTPKVKSEIRPVPRLRIMPQHEKKQETTTSFRTNQPDPIQPIVTIKNIPSSGPICRISSRGQTTDARAARVQTKPSKDDGDDPNFDQKKQELN